MILSIENILIPPHEMKRKTTRYQSLLQTIKVGCCYDDLRRSIILISKVVKRLKNAYLGVIVRK